MNVFIFVVGFILGFLMYKVYFHWNKINAWLSGVNYCLECGGISYKASCGISHLTCIKCLNQNNSWSSHYR